MTIKDRMGTVKLQDQTSKSYKEKGFTIIEVLIVLVIAGLIMLVVFLAVPALQRNGRNTERRSDASRVLAVTNEWKVNNNNRNPAACVDPATLCGSGGSNNTDRQSIVDATGQLKFFSTNKVGVASSGWIGGWFDPMGMAVNGDRILIVPRAKCSTGAISAGSDLVVVFPVETGSGKVGACV